MKSIYIIVINGFVLMILLAFSVLLNAQTASERPLSAVITKRIKEQFDKKKHDQEVSASSSRQHTFPSGSVIPHQATESTVNHPVQTLKHRDRSEKLPSNSKLDIDEIIQLNKKFVAPDNHY